MRACYKCGAECANLYGIPVCLDCKTSRLKSHNGTKRGDRYLSKYGITEEQYQRLLDAQGGCCAICRNPPGSRRLSVDHDHNCCPMGGSCGDCVRGLLCTRCNLMLGYADDDTETLLRARDYLITHQE